MKKLTFYNYNYYVISSWNEFSLAHEIKKLSAATNKVLLISDTNVYNLYAKDLANQLSGYTVYEYILKPGDIEKNITNYNKIIDFLITNQFARNDLIISLGGGMVSDLGGFVAATFKRGIKHVVIPTTIIGQIDASIGGKVGINFTNYKNQVGSFYDPILVVSNLSYLETLPVEEYKSGLGELIKTGLIGDRKLITYFMEKEKICEDIIIRALNVKKKYIEKDYYDHSERAVLNLGHSFAHAIESKSNFTMPHGIAVLEGMIMALDFGEFLKITNPDIRPKLEKIINHLDIKIKLPNFKDCLEYLKNDKKANIDGINLITLEEIEKPVIIQVSWDDFNAINS